MTVPFETSICIGLPVLNDANSIEEMVQKSIRLLDGVCRSFEIIIINDGSTDNSAAIIEKLVATYPFVKAVHHSQNLGYGYTTREIITLANSEWVCMVDGDGDYDVNDVRKFFNVMGYYDLIITFRYVKLYSGYRIFLSFMYNRLLSFLFETKFRDVSTGLRMIRKNVATDIQLVSTSPFIGAEMAVKVMMKGYRVGEVGIQTFPKQFSTSYSTTPANILKTVKDMRRVYRQIFSRNYELPDSNKKEGKTF